jgi:hypothetical protein
MVRTDSRLFSRGRRYLGHSQRKRLPFRLRGCHPLWPAFPDLSAASTICQILSRRAAGTRYPATPRTQRPPTWHVLRFRLFRVRSPLLTESMARSVPVVTEMFHFATCGSPACAGGTGYNPAGFPHSEIQGSQPAQRFPLAYRSSQRPSSPLGAKASPMHP